MPRRAEWDPRISLLRGISEHTRPHSEYKVPFNAAMWGKAISQRSVLFSLTVSLGNVFPPPRAVILTNGRSYPACCHLNLLSIQLLTVVLHQI